MQIVDQKIPLKPHDISLDFIVTPNETIKCKKKSRSPKGIYWDYLDQEKIEAIPLLKKLKTRLGD